MILGLTDEEAQALYVTLNGVLINGVADLSFIELIGQNKSRDYPNALRSVANRLQDQIGMA